MKMLEENVAVSSDPLDYVSSVYYFAKKFSHIQDKNEVMSTAYEALVRAHHKFVRGNMTGDCRSYINEAIHNALLQLQIRIKRDVKVHKSLEELLVNVDDEPGTETEILFEKEDYIASVESMIMFHSFVETLDEADRVIFLFREKNPDLTIAETAERLAKAYSHLDIPCKQPGLTKRLQRINSFYHAYKKKTGV